MLIGFIVSSNHFVISALSEAPTIQLLGRALHRTSKRINLWRCGDRSIDLVIVVVLSEAVFGLVFYQSIAS